MGSIVSGFYTLLGCGPTAEDKKRVKYLTRISSFSLLEASLPVFIAAAIANAAEAIIVGIGEETIALLIVQYMLYATIVYVVGKSITGVLYRDEENNSDHAFFVAIRKYKLSKLIRHVAAENSGFAWKEFFVTLALRLAFDEHGWGAAFAAWLAAVAFFVSAIFLSNWVQRAVLGVGLSTNDKLLSFDADAAALPLAFVLTVLLALGMRGLGAGFVSESSYLYAWNDQFEENAPGGPYTFDVCFAYALVVSLVVGSILALSNTAEEREEAQAEADHSAGSFQIEANAAGTAELTAPRRDGGWFRDSSPVDACRELWENFLGYFCGVAYFILVIDNIKLGPLIPQLDALVSSFLGVLFVALVVTWKGPNCLASMKLRQEKIEAKMAAAALKKRGASETASEVPADEEHGAVAWLCDRYEAMSDFCLRVGHRRKDLMIVSMRLVVGWAWEIVVQQVFAMLGANEHDNVAVETLVQCVLAVVVVLLSLAVHLYIRDWDAAATAEEGGVVSAAPSASTETNDEAARGTRGSEVPVSSQIVDEETRSPMF